MKLRTPRKPPAKIRPTPRHTPPFTLCPEVLESRLNLSTLAGLAVPPATTALDPVQIVGAPTAAAAAPTPLAGTSAASQQVVPVASYTAISNCRIELQPGQSRSDIGYVAANGAYVEYTINTASAGTYSLTLGLASYSGANVQVSVNATPQATITAPTTNSWIGYTDGTTSLQLKAGSNVLRFSAQNGTQYNINAIALTQTAVAPTPTPAPATSPAAAAATHVTTTIGDNTSVAVPSYAAIYNSQLEYLDHGPDIGYVSTSGAYVEYAIDVATAGNYTLTTTVANVNDASFDVSSDGLKLASFSSPATGDWQAFSPLSQTISLKAGTQTLRFTATNATQYNLGGIQFIRQIAPVTATPTPTPAPTPKTAPAAPISVSSRLMTSFDEIDIVGTTGNDSIVVTQSNGMLNITANGQTQQAIAFGELVIWGGDGNDTITVNSSVNLDTRIYGGAGNNTLTNLTRGQATIVSVGGGIDSLMGNGINTSFWADSSDNVVATPAETANNGVHIISGFQQPYTTTPGAAGYVSMQLDGPNLRDPTANATGTVRLTNSSFFGTGPVQTDINQGNANDCYFLTALQSLARTQPEALRQMGVDLGDGTYAIAFKRGGQTQYLRVDGDLPANASGVVYNRTGISGNQWASIFEKAYAYFRTGQNSYASLDYGFMTPVYTDLGVSATTFTLSSDQNAFFGLASSTLSAGNAVDICTNPTIVKNAPLIASHTYSIVNTWRDAGGTVWVTLRNPWGIDGFNVDSNTWDGMLTMTYATLQANATSGTLTA